MAFGRLERNPRPAPMADINMTPLIDVMLVLMVIFLITAPLMTSGLQLDLPQTDAAAPTDGAASITIAIDAQGRVTLDDAPVTAPVLAQRLGETARRNAATEVQLRADKTVAYGQVAQLIGTLQQAGLKRIAFIAEAASGATK